MVPSGFLEGQSPYSANLGSVIKDLPQAKNAIDWYAEHGYPQLKIYNSFPKAILAETVAYAHRAACACRATFRLACARTKRSTRASTRSTTSTR
ncbi:hypothetical protein LP420_18505 [Massilia sp. B-10]|nr:hypothetical protein LP420_18505 [Massilia sp. B-10]